MSFIPNLLFILILFFSVIVHEIAHGYAALIKGDTTARDAGRLTFNPIPHIDIFGTIILPLILSLTHTGILIGWAKPVPINPYFFRNPKKDLIVVSAAGPLSNIGLAIILSIIIRFLHVPNQFIVYGVIINLLLAFFNLLPIPPLDGSQILASLLPYEAREKYMTVGRYGFIILFLLVGAGLINYLLIPLVNVCFHFLTGI